MLTAVKFFALVAAMFVAAACTKKEIPGPQGDPGLNGTGGNVNTSSQIFTIGSSQWILEDKIYVYSHATDLISQEVMSKGGVKVFVEKSGGWWALPLADGDLIMQAGFKTGSVEFQFFDIHDNIPAAPETANYKLVVFSESAKSIPGAETVYYQDFSAR